MWISLLVVRSWCERVLSSPGSPLYAALFFGDGCFVKELRSDDIQSLRQSCWGLSLSVGTSKKKDNLPRLGDRPVHALFKQFLSLGNSSEAFGVDFDFRQSSCAMEFFYP